MSTLAEQLRELRRQSGRTLKQASEELGISEPFLSDIERGRRIPLDNVLERFNLIASLYGVRFVIGAEKLDGDPTS
jgi:transcriptional regulator with XRE-family HTH domain